MPTIAQRIADHMQALLQEQTSLLDQAQAIVTQGGDVFVEIELLAPVADRIKIVTTKIAGCQDMISAIGLADEVGAILAQVSAKPQE